MRGFVKYVYTPKGSQCKRSKYVQTQKIPYFPLSSPNTCHPPFPRHLTPLMATSTPYRSGPAAGARAFLESPPPGVVLCANRLGSRQEVEEAVVHELVHAYDYMVAGIELRKCRSLAYRSVVAFNSRQETRGGDRG